MNYLLPERLDRLAREYVLGTLTGPARRRFERLLRQAPLALRAVGAWQERLAVLAGSVPEMQPRDSVWQGLERRLFPAPAAGGATPEAGRGLQWLWRLLPGRALGGALAGVLLCVLVLRQDPQLLGLETQSEALPASYVGLLTDANGNATVLASSRRHGNQLTVKLLRPVVVPPGKVAQLWALPKDGAPPFPVGVVPGQGSARVPLADSSEKLFANVSRLAVSIESAPARVGDKPGEFVLSGHCVKLW